MDIPQAWLTISKNIFERKGLIFIVGATDSGKSTLAKYLTKEWTGQGYKVALVDCDMGQSTLGPPCIMSMKIFDKANPDFESPHNIQNVSLFFIGSFSPVGHL